MTNKIKDFQFNTNSNFFPKDKNLQTKNNPDNATNDNSKNANHSHRFNNIDDIKQKGRPRKETVDVLRKAKTIKFTDSEYYLLSEKYKDTNYRFSSLSAYLKYIIMGTLTMKK